MPESSRLQWVEFFSKSLMTQNMRTLAQKIQILQEFWNSKQEFEFSRQNLALKK